MAAVRVSALVRRLRAPNPSPMTGDGTNTYLVGDRSVIVIDPGPDLPQHVDAILSAVGGTALARILLTHRHTDHAPAAAALSRTTGAPVLAFPEVRDGHTVGGGRIVLEALHTPGHASDHLAYVLPDEGAAFTGDLVIAGSSVLVAPPDGDMAAYLASLERLCARGLRRLYPGHGDVIEEPSAVIDHTLRHRFERERQILDALRAGPARIDAVVSRIYVDTPASMHRWAARSVHAHLLKLRADGRVAGTDAEHEWRMT